MLYNDDPLNGWYPGLGEVQILDRMHPDLRCVLADAASEDPSFINDYVLPVLWSPDPTDRLLSDLADALTGLEFEEIGLGELSELEGLGGSLKKKLRKSIKRVGRSVKRVAKSSVGQAVAAPLTMGLSVKSVREGIKKGLSHKYAAPVIGVTGAAFAPFTGGASMAAAATILAANQARQAKKAAQAAKRAAKIDARRQAAVTRTADAQTRTQVNQFYAQNRSWFLERGITQARWNSMTLAQKVATIDAAAKGTLPVSGQVPVPTAEAAGAGAGVEDQAGGGAYPAGSGPGPTAGGGGGSPGGGGGGGEPAPTGERPMAQAGLFSGPLPLIMAAGALVYLLFGRKGHGRKTRRNPSRGSRRWIVAA